MPCPKFEFLSTYTKLAPNSKRDERKARGADGADGRNSDEEAEVSKAR